jgi:hypothetical protein
LPLHSLPTIQAADHWRRPPLERQTDPVILEGAFDEGKGASSHNELLARFGRELESDLNSEITERFDALPYIPQVKSTV